jgi:poly-gamma-glutamate synthesis protein (capsule biosynthesis protein)
MLLTANNHSYDTRHTGFLRTQQIIADRGLAHIGTRQEADADNFAVVDINGIRIGMINYTYNTGVNSKTGTIGLNTIPLSKEDEPLVNSFDYNHLDLFYTKLAGELEAMKAAGAEATVLYIHWGDEYKITPNTWQTQMAQQLCNMGIDVIVGNHAHVPQPVELLTSETDESQKTLCLYSTGNSVSNIYKTSRFPVNTEDGMLFTFTFAKYSDGTVVVESADVLPTWVWRYDDENGVRKFKIMTLDEKIEDWQAALGVSGDTLQKCRDSYDRTMGIVGEGIAEANTWYAQAQAEVEAALGVIS